MLNRLAYLGLALAVLLAPLGLCGCAAMEHVTPADRAFVNASIDAVAAETNKARQQGSNLATLVDGLWITGAAVASILTGRALYRKGNVQVAARQHVEGRAAAQVMGAPSGQEVSIKAGPGASGSLGGQPLNT